MIDANLIDANFWLRGLLIGFSIAAPVGPIGILGIRRTLTDGLLMGVLTGLGAATADAMYGAIAGFGLTAVSNVLIQQSVWLRLVGGLFLCYLGIRIFLSPPIEAGPAAIDAPKNRRSQSLFAAYSSTVFLTLTNPATILSFAAVFAGLGLADSRSSYGEAMVLVLGVFMGSALWWLLLCGTVSWFRQRLRATGFSGGKGWRWINRVSGLILLTFGIIALVSGMRMM